MSSSVKFNVEEEAGFLSSLVHHGPTVPDDVLQALQQIVDRKMTFDDFKREFGWVRIVLTGDNTYPGADPLHYFVVEGASGAIYQIAAKGPYGAIIVCSVTLRP